MNAAIYARKSTEQKGADAEAKSVLRQIDNAKKFAATLGRTVADRYIYADDAISGAHTLKLKERQRLLQDIAAGAIDLLIIRDESRFSRRDGHLAFTELESIAKKGVAIWFYAEHRRFAYGDMASNIMGNVRSEMAAEQRRTTARNVAEALLKKAEAGHVAGGRIYGYDNVRCDGHVERRINPEQAAVVRRIYDLAALGWGFQRIARQLTVDKVPTPRPTASGSWHGRSVKWALNQPMYRGQVFYNTTAKKDGDGKTIVVPRPRHEWLQRSAPQLRIVSDLQHEKVQRLMRKRRDEHTTYGGRPVGFYESKYLLVGFMRCECGSGVHVRERRLAGGKVFGYCCTNYYAKGQHVCSHPEIWQKDVLDLLVVDAIKFALTGDRFDRIMALVKKHYDARTSGNRAVQLRTDLVKVEQELARLTEAVAAGAGQVGIIVERLQATERKRQAIEADLRNCRKTDGAGKWADVERLVRRNLSNWQTQLTGKTSVARDWFRRALTEPIRLHPYSDHGRPALRFEGRLSLSVLFGGAWVISEPATTGSSTDYTAKFQGIYSTRRQAA